MENEGIRTNCAYIGTIGHVGHGKTTLSAALTAILSNEEYKQAFTTDISKVLEIEEPKVLSIDYGTKKGYSITTIIDIEKDKIISATNEDDYLIGIAGYNPCSVTDGDYVRTVVYIGGCTHGCPGCHNKEYWDNKGSEYNIDKFYDERLKDNKYITISGGDGLTTQYKQTLNLLKLLKSKDHNVWLYTGYTYEELLNSNKEECLKYIDVLVDGKFEKDKRDITLFFKGSSNQRIIDVKQSLENNKVILYELEVL